MKKRSVLGIIISIIMSIVLVPFIWATQILATTTMTISSVVKEERKHEILSTFMQNNGGEWIYGMVKPVLDEVVAEYATEIDGLQTEDLLTVDDTNKILTGFYEKAVNGEIYEVDLTFLADRIKPQLEGIVEKEIDKQIDAQADTEIETYVDENLESIYASLSDDVKAQIKNEVKPTVYEEGKKTVLAEVEKEFDAQIGKLVEEEVDKYIKENYPNAPAKLVKEEKEKYLKENKDRIVAEARAEVMAEAEAQFDAEFDAQFEEEAETYISENIREIYNNMDENTKAELIAKAKEEFLPQFKEEYKAQYMQQYVDEAAAAIDEAVLSAQNEVNATIAGIYESEEYAQVEQMQEEYALNIYDFNTLHEGFQMAGFICFGATAVLVLILLLSYLFRPAGFFVAGIFTLVIGVGVKAVTGTILTVVKQMVSTSVEMPHESLGALLETALGWVAEGLSGSAMYSIYGGAALFLLGILVLILRKAKTA